MNCKNSSEDKLYHSEEIWDDKYSCFSEEENEKVEVQTLNTTIQFNNSLKVNKGKIKQEDMQTFRNEDFCIDKKHSSEKIIDSLPLEVQINENLDGTGSYTVIKVKSHNGDYAANEKRNRKDEIIRAAVVMGDSWTKIRQCIMAQTAHQTNCISSLTN